MKLYDLMAKVFPGLKDNNNEQRDKWVKETLKQIPAGLKILDVGAGEQQYRKYCAHLEYISQDFCQYDGIGDQNALQTSSFDTSKTDVVSDITSIPLDDNSFDAIICTEVLEHVPDPIRAFKEMNRLLKSGGYLVMTAPFASCTHFSPYHFATGFNKYFYEYILGEDYEIKELKPNGNFYSFLNQEVLRTPYIYKLYNQKSLNIFYKAFLFISSLILHRLSKKDTKSSEVLCYGYFLFAKKR